MATITASSVKELRERTGLPLMDCKKALTEAEGDQDAAVALLRKRGADIGEKRADRETAFGRFGLYVGVNNPAGAMVEFKCESAPVTKNDEFIALANDLAEAYAKNPQVTTADELLDLPAPSGETLRVVKDDLFNRIREVFNVGRMVRVEGGTGGYSHNSGTVSGALIAVEGGDDESAKDICMHIAAMRPKVLNIEDVDAATVAAERNILREAALKEGKPEKIVDKMVDGRMKSFYATSVLVEQEFVKSDDKSSVGKFAKSKGMTLKAFTLWELGVE